jgi:uncharacterized membrane protein
VRALPTRVDAHAARVRDVVRTSLWPLPAAAIVAAAAAGVALPRLDGAVDAHLPDWLNRYLFGGGASAARTILDAIASSLITVTALTFSLTVVTLQLASSQFSPRLLRTFTRDLFVQTTLALFLATFTFSLTVLRAVRTSAEERVVFVPQISVTMAFVLALASVMLLVLFLAHLTKEIRVESMVATVHADASQTAARLVGALRRDGAAALPVLPAHPAAARPLMAPSSGFVVGVDHGRLVAAALGAEAVIVLDCRVGDSVVAGTPIGWMWSLRDDGSLYDDEATSVAAAVCAAVATGFERTPSQDLGLGLRQLTDVAVKALSPGINDPTTAIHAIHHSAAFLCELDPADLGPRVRHDDSGRATVAFALPTFGELLNLAVDQPRRYGSADAEVLLGIMALLRAVAWRSGAAQAPQVRDQLERTRRAATGHGFDPSVAQRLDAAERAVNEALDGAAGS